MPVQPIPCESGGGNGAPVDVTTCCAPAIASTALCREDGTALLLVVRSGCADCGADAPDPEGVGWIDTTTGAFTAGPPPADAGPCAVLDGCEEPTQPVAMTGLCLADGTPISVVVTRDCAGTVTQEGWINLTTGAWSAGAPPAGAVACGDSRSIQVSGTFCDIDPGGDVLGLVLIEYQYAADGSIEAVRLVDATTGDTYTPQGEVTTCPAGVEQPARDLIQLCDTADDGSVTPFVRDYARDENGAIVGHSDYTLDGAPYTPAGDVGVCSGPPVEECTHCQTLTLCDVLYEESPGGGVEVPWSVTSVEPDPDSDPGRGFLFHLSPVDDPSMVGTVRVTSNTVANVVCDPGGPFDLGFSNTNDLVFELDEVAQQMSYLRVDLTDFDDFEPVQIHASSPPPSRLGGTAIWNEAGTQIIPTESNGTGEMYWDNPPATFGYRIWNTGGGISCSSLNFAGVTVLLPPPTGTPRPFWRTVCRDCSGAPVSITDTDVDGTTPYSPQGEITSCATAGGGDTPPVEPCRDSSTVLLCDVAAQEPITVFDPANVPGSDGWQVVSYETVTGNPPEAPLPYDAPHPVDFPAFMGAREDLSAGAGPSWPGYDAAPHRWVLRKTFIAPEDGIAVVSSTGFRADGGGRVRVNDQDAGMYGQWNQPATSGTAQIPVTEGPNVVEIEVRDGAGDNWVTGRLDVVMTRTVQFLRRTITDCETGATVEVIDTDLDGEPYQVAGEIGACEAVGGGCCEEPPPETRVDVETGLMCLLDEDGVSLGEVLVELVYDDQSGDRIEQRLTDPTTGELVELPDGATVGRCPAPAGEECRDSTTVLLCDLDPECQAGVEPSATDEPAPASFNNWGPGSAPYWCHLDTPGQGAPVWAGGSVVLGPDPACPTAAGGDTHRVIGVRLAAGSPSLTGTVELTVSLRVTNQGPNAGWVGDGRFALWDASGGGSGTRLTYVNVASSAPVGHVQTLTITRQVPAAALAAGDIVAVLDLETYHSNGEKAWLVDEFVWSAEVPAVDCEQQVLRTITRDCATGETISVVDTTLDGEPYEVGGEIGQCTPAGSTPAPGGEPCGDTELLHLCDLDATGQATAEFVRRYVYDCDGQIVDTADSTLDGQPYEVTGIEGRCPDASEARDVELIPLCVTDDESGAVIQEVLAEAVYDAAGERVTQRLVDRVTGAPVSLPGGTSVTVCPAAEAPVTVLEQCRCDDTTGDGAADTDYVELIAVGADGTLTSVGTYTEELTGPYVPVAPVPCDTGAVGGAPAATAARTRRVVVEPGGTWQMPGGVMVQAVTMLALGGTATVTTVDGDSPLSDTESAGWSLVRDQDAGLAGPLAVVAETGSVAVSWTEAVTL